MSPVPLIDKNMERLQNNTSVPARQPASLSGVLSVKRIIGLLLHNWYWFVLSLAVAFGFAYLKIQKTPPVYSRTASILIKTDANSGDRTLRELGITQTPSNLNNEILMMRTSVVATEVVRRLNLDVDYLLPGTFYKKTIYGVNLPFNVKFLDLNDNESSGLHLDLAKDSTVVLSSMRRGGVVSEGAIKMHLGDTVQSPAGLLTVIPSMYYKKGAETGLDVERLPLGSAVSRVSGRIYARLRSDEATIIDISYNDVSPQRAEDVLSTLVSVYNENWMLDRNRRIVSANEFIKDRLGVIEQELGDVDQGIASYKSEHLILDVNQAGGMALSEATEAERQALSLENTMRLLRSIRDFVMDESNMFSQIPYTSGMNSGIVERGITEYNRTLMERNNHLAHSSLQNPRIMEYDRQIRSMRETLLISMNSELAVMQNTLSGLRATRSQAYGKVAANPSQAKYLLSVERLQRVKEQLYMFLLQKREENELSQAFTAYNTQLIEPPHGAWGPISPVPRNIYLIALLLGLAVPAVILFLSEVLKSTVQGRDDLKVLTAPFAGEIPLVRFKGKKKKKGKDSKTAVPEVLVADKNRDVMNESFRVARSNLEFMLGYDSTHKIVMLTSLNPGSGKTFITANLATAVGIKGKKVLAIDLDLRKASLSEYVESPHRGLSSYLSGKEDDYHDLIVKLGNIDILPCGKLPPNPSELLYTTHFEQLMNSVREEYDYVFVDCPPVEIVADASIVNRFVDQTLFVIRAKLMERSFLPEIEQWYQEKRYKNLSVILNGTTGDAGYSRYGYHKYGYYGRYGYGYGKAAYGKTAYGNDVKES